MIRFDKKRIRSRAHFSIYLNAHLSGFPVALLDVNVKSYINFILHHFCAAEEIFEKVISDDSPQLVGTAGDNPRNDSRIKVFFYVRIDTVADQNIAALLLHLLEDLHNIVHLERRINCVGLKRLQILFQYPLIRTPADIVRLNIKYLNFRAVLTKPAKEALHSQAAPLIAIIV